MTESSSFDLALDRLKAAQKSGEDLNRSAEDWNLICATMADPNLSPSKQSDYAIKVIARLPGTKYDAIAEGIINNNVNELNDSGHIDEAIKLMGKALSGGKGLSGIHGDSPEETTKHLKDMTDKDLAGLNPQTLNTLLNELNDAKTNLPCSIATGQAEEDSPQAIEYKDQINRLKKAKEENNSSVETSSSEGWNVTNSAHFMSMLEHYSKTDLTKATTALADVLIDPASQSSSVGNAMWCVFDQYITRLSDPKNPQHDEDAANKQIKRVWDSLPPDDTIHRTALKILADNNGYNPVTNMVEVEWPKPIIQVDPVEPGENGQAQRYDVHNMLNVSSALLVPPLSRKAAMRSVAS